MWNQWKDPRTIGSSFYFQFLGCELYISLMCFLQKEMKEQMNHFALTLDECNVRKPDFQALLAAAVFILAIDRLVLQLEIPACLLCLCTGSQPGPRLLLSPGWGVQEMRKGKGGDLAHIASGPRGTTHIAALIWTTDCTQVWLFINFL